MHFQEFYTGPRALLAGVTWLALSSLTVLAAADVPPNIETALRAIGPIVDPACTAKLYRPLMPANDITSHVDKPYPGLTVVRNQSFGPDPKDVVDVFTADQGAASRTVFIFVPGGDGNKNEIQAKEANAFYDNIGRWATKHGMVGVTMQRHASTTWDGGAKDVSAMIQWLQANISRYHGNPERMFISAHSAGNISVGTYMGRPELYGPKGVGVKGVIFISGAGAFNILPAQAPPRSMADFTRSMNSAGKTCGESGGVTATGGALPGVAPGQPGGPPPARPAGSGPPDAGAPRMPPGTDGPPVDAATQLARSSLPELKKTSVRIMLANAELDSGADMAVNGGMLAFNKALSNALCAEGPAHCPTVAVAKGHSHMSIVFAFDTADTTFSGSVLDFIKKTH